MRDTLSPSESLLSSQGSDYDLDLLKFPPPLPPDLKVDSFVEETPLCIEGLWFDLSADPFAGEATSDHAPDSLSPSVESLLSSQGSDYDPDTLKFPPPLPLDLNFLGANKGSGFGLSGNSFAAVESEALSHRSDLSPGEGVRASNSSKFQSGCAVKPGLANWDCHKEAPWKHRRKMKGEEEGVVGSKPVISTPCYLFLLYVYRLDVSFYLVGRFG